jgi:hypothetical protein
MKKVLIGLVLSVLTLISYSQIVYSRAYKFHVGALYNDKIHWDNGNPSDVIIAVNSMKMVIGTDDIQTYHVIDNIRDEKYQSKWLALDKNGSRCHIYIGVDVSSNETYVIIEYSTTAFCFYVKQL